jgi:hypothetical protein
MHERVHRGFSGITTPAWFLIAWEIIAGLHQLEWMSSKMDMLWNLVLSSHLMRLSAALIWLTLVMTWPELKQGWPWSRRFTVMFSQEPPHRQEISYRLRVRGGYAVIENLEARVLDISPPPWADIYRPDYPYNLRPVSNPDLEVRVTLNPKQEESFEIFRWWIASGGKVMVAGIGRDRSLPIEISPGEFWYMRVRVISSKKQSEAWTILVQGRPNGVYAASITGWESISAKISAIDHT